MCWRNHLKRGFHCELLQRKSSFLTVTLTYRLRTIRVSVTVTSSQHALNLWSGVSVESRDDSVFLHDEADITIISNRFQSGDASRQVVRIPSDDNDIFVLLIYWTWRYDLHVRVAVQMEKRDGVDMCQLREHSVLTGTWSPCAKRLLYCVLPLRQKQGLRSEGTESIQLSRAVRRAG